jgi:hypothetical protein
MAIAYQTQYNAITASQVYFPTTSSLGQYSAILSPLIIEAQTQAILGAADAVAFVSNTANRAFLINNDLVDHTLTYNGRPWVFTAGDAFCMHPDELAHFLGQATQLGFGIVQDPAGVAYLAGAGVIQFFYF